MCSGDPFGPPLHMRQIDGGHTSLKTVDTLAQANRFPAGLHGSLGYVNYGPTRRAL